jgi:HlyD family secretion protein
MRTPRHLRLFGLGCALVGAAGLSRADPDSDAVTALGRLEPRGGPVRVAGPSVPVAVIAELEVEEGESVKEGQVLARLDRFALQQAVVRQREAELAQAEAELRRAKNLAQGLAGAASKREDAEAIVRAAQATLDAARAELELALVRAPIAGRVLEVHARAGERVGPEGVVELGRTDEMFAVAEVYETDIGRVKAGQRALVSSPALAKPLAGAVERVGLKIGRLDVVGADPIAKTDARVVEVEIRLDEPAAVANLTNLQVEVEITP